MYRHLITISFLVTLIHNEAWANNLLHEADSLYSNQLYSEAMDRYEFLLNDDRFLKNDFDLNFKLAYCYLQNKKYDSARNILLKLKLQTNLIPEYLDYFICLAHYQQDETRNFKRESARFLRNYASHFLADSILFYMSDYAYRSGDYREAQIHYQKLMQNKKFSKNRPLFMFRMAMCDVYLSRKSQAMEKFYQTLLKYPSSEEALQIAEMLDAYHVDEKKYIFPVTEVYIQHNSFSTVRSRLENFIRATEDKNLIEKARFYLIRLYYEEGQYQTAKYGFNTLLQNLQNKSLEPRILLMIARCELRAGQKDKAARSYLHYAETYPRRRMAVEAVWKAAWIYEELGEIESSLAVYIKLKLLWPRSAYRSETDFRIGLSYYRLGMYDEATEAFRYISLRNGSTFDNHRGLYWLAKTFKERGMAEEARKIHIDLGSQLLNSYYALKVYFENQAYVDSVLNFKVKIAEIENPLREYTANISPYMVKFKKLFVVHELLSDQYSYQEVNEKTYRAASVAEWIALAEIYKRLGAYNRAFQVYDYLDNKHFYTMDNLEKPFLLKEAFPLYYDSEISEYASRRQLDRKLVMAVIRAESAYNKRAHSWADAYGLMQIIPPTAAELASELSVSYADPENLFNADLNINMGTYYMKKLLRQFDNTYEYALAAYNAGPHRVTKWLKMLPENDIDIFIENIEFSQTRNYVRKVLRNYWIYSFLEKLN